MIASDSGQSYPKSIRFAISPMVCHLQFYATLTFLFPLNFKGYCELN